MEEAAKDSNTCTLCSALQSQSFQKRQKSSATKSALFLCDRRGKNKTAQGSNEQSQDAGNWALAETQWNGISLLRPSGRAETGLRQFPTRVYSSSALYSQACLTFSFSLATSMICSNEALSSLVCFAKKVSRLGRASLSSFSASPNKRREEAWGRLMSPFLWEQCFYLLTHGHTNN